MLNGTTEHQLRVPTDTKLKGNRRRSVHHCSPQVCRPPQCRPRGTGGKRATSRCSCSFGSPCLQRPEVREAAVTGQFFHFSSPSPLHAVTHTHFHIQYIYIYIPSRVTLDTELCSVFRVKACICSPFCSLCISSFLHFNPFHHISKAANEPHALPFASRRLLWI